MNFWSRPSLNSNEHQGIGVTYEPLSLLISTGPTPDHQTWVSGSVARYLYVLQNTRVIVKQTPG